MSFKLPAPSTPAEAAPDAAHAPASVDPGYLPVPNARPEDLAVGQFIHYKSRGQHCYGQIANVDENGLRWHSGALPEEIPEDVWIQPVKWAGGVMMQPATTPAWQHVRPPVWRSGIPCANRHGQTPVFSPQCDGSLDAVAVLRSSKIPPRTKQPSEATEIGGANYLSQPDVESTIAQLMNALDFRDDYLCTKCARNFWTPGKVRPEDRSGCLHSIRPPNPAPIKKRRAVRRTR